MPRWTDASFVEELPRLLRERDMSVRRLAQQVGVADSHLSRVLRRANYKTVSPDLARRVALALHLDEGYVPETREGFVMERVSQDAVLRDRLYRQLRG